MAEIFSGDWVVEFVDYPVAHIPYRVIIEGSLTSDGVYPLEITTPPVTVSGPRWSIKLEWYEYRGEDRLASRERKPNRSDLHPPRQSCRDPRPHIQPWAGTNFPPRRDDSGFARR